MCVHEISIDKKEQEGFFYEIEADNIFAIRIDSLIEKKFLDL